MRNCTMIIMTNSLFVIVMMTGTMQTKRRRITETTSNMMVFATTMKADMDVHRDEQQIYCQHYAYDAKKLLFHIAKISFSIEILIN